ncbi:ubiquitin carboxyl-terminal hydrolase 23 [Dorcoceras hygrometricum]|uniref:Ubiquitin carboxyl-terminal hydrolase 23 n=1 Tax=Dorcoceras hygrometricum TaxID=472368 RepID=A0A2Z7B302_9LAMI|nr:ubiquitin carboxyl-terminal hydrolase 23 [Dorcoceras hygrometricum]
MMNCQRICPADGSQYKQSAVGLVFMESAAGLAMETSKVESAVLAIQEAKKSRKMELERRSSAGSYGDQQEANVNQQLRSLGVLTAAGCGIGSVHKLKSAGTSLKRNQQVATVLPGVSYNEPAVATHPVVGKSSRKLQCYCISSRLGTQTQENKKQAKCRDSTSRELQNPVARKEDVAKLCNQAQSFQSTKISVEDEFSRSDKLAAKQLTIYEELSKLDTHFKREEVVSNGKKFEQRLYIFEERAIEDTMLRNCEAEAFPSKNDDVKLVYVVSHTVEAVVHLRSLGVLTAAGCGIGSVHKL